MLQVDYNAMFFQLIYSIEGFFIVWQHAADKGTGTAPLVCIDQPRYLGNMPQDRHVEEYAIR